MIFFVVILEEGRLIFSSGALALEIARRGCSSVVLWVGGYHGRSTDLLRSQSELSAAGLGSGTDRKTNSG